MPRLSASVKLKACKQVLENGESVSEVSGALGCSRQSLFLWIKKYQKNPKKGSSALKNQYLRGRNHPRYLGWKIEKLILDLVVKNPDLSVNGLYREVKKLGYAVSSHGIYNALIRYDLVTRELRHRFSLAHPTKTLFAFELAPAYRAKIVEEYLRENHSISAICAKWRISRPTFYFWLANYRLAISEAMQGGASESEAQAQVVAALVRKYKKGSEHHRSLSGELEEVVLGIVRSNPELSAHRIHARVPVVDGKPVVGHHGVQNVLARYELNTYNRRLEWAAAQRAPEAVPAPAEAPALPRGLLIRLISPFATVPKVLISQPITWPIAVPILLFVAYIFEVDKVFRPTVFFPILALTFGFIFFFYSMKYYVSLILVLWLGSKGQGRASLQNSQAQLAQSSVANLEAANTVGLQPQQAGGKAGIFSRLFGGGAGAGGVGLVEDLSGVELKSRPFVSIHLPMYNEKRVVERVIAACSSFGWEDAGKANYEVIIIDDSNDETTEIAKNFLKSRAGQISAKRGTNGEEIVISVPSKVGEPVITLIHRLDRAGFKGGALSFALARMDVRAEYVLVFDADFVPYPDTIEQFVKYFQLVNANSNIAAVQGYQWHVLNKSENWVTRGVRSEYAGSYVVERSAIELYGGLKMIAGSVYAIRADVLRQFGWGTSITEDLELTLRLYEKGYKVVYTPYIQAPAEAVSTIRRMIRQRMRWAEGHSFNVRKQFKQIVNSPYLSFSEKVEFAYLGPYYLQAAFFVVGTLAWFLAEVVLKVNLPFWTAALGWSLVFSNFLALPLINLLGLFLEQSEEKDYLGVFSFVVLSYIVTPFQAYASLKGFLEKEEGPWFRTPKSGKVTDVIGRVRVGHWELKWPSFGKPAVAEVSGVLAPVSSFNPLQGYEIKPRRISLVSRSVIAAFLVIVMLVNYLAFFAQPKEVSATGTPKLEQQINIIDQEYSTTSTSYAPTDNSLGLITWPCDVMSINLTNSSATASSASSVSWTHTVNGANADNTLLVVAVTIANTSAAPTIDTVSYGGQALIKLGGVSRTYSAAGSIIRSELWYKKLPLTGSNTVAVNLSAAADINAGAVSYVGVNQTTPFGTYASATGSSTAPSVDVSSAAGEVVVDALSIANNSTATAGTGQSLKWTQNQSADRGSSSTEDGASSVTMSWTIGTSGSWAIGGASIKPVTASACSKYSDLNRTNSMVFFEVDIKRDTSGFVYAALYDSSGTYVIGSEVGTTSSTYARVRSTPIKAYLRANTNYSVRIKTTANTAYIQAARLIVYQEGASGDSLTATQTQVEVGAAQAVAVTSYAVLTERRDYCYNSADSNATTCSAGSVWSPVPTAYFEASLVAGSGGTTYASLYTLGGSTVTCGAGTAEISTTSTSWTLVRTACSLSLSAGTEYVVRVKYATAAGSIANAKIILDQSSSVDKVETVQQYVNNDMSTTTTYANLGFANSFDSTDFSATSLTYIHEAMIYAADGKGPSGTVKSQISGGAQNLGEVTTTSTTNDRYRSATFTPTTAVFDSQLECTSCSNRTAHVESDWLIIQNSGIPVPEIAIFALPGVLFLPRLVRWIKEKRKARKKKAFGGRNPPKLGIRVNFV